MNNFFSIFKKTDTSTQSNVTRSSVFMATTTLSLDIVHSTSFINFTTEPEIVKDNTDE
jgi:hypothetical protein